MGCSKPSEFYAPFSTKSRYAAVYANAASQPDIQLGGSGWKVTGFGWVGQPKPVGVLSDL